MPAAPTGTPGPRRPGAIWLEPRACWAGLAIISMWLAVLFVGIFGGDIVSSSSGGGSSAVPAAIALAPFAMVGTIVVGRRGFGGRDGEWRAALDEERRARERLAADVAELRARSTSGPESLVG